MGNLPPFDLDYNRLREEQILNNTQTGLQHANHADEEQLDFASALENPELADSSDKYVVAQLIGSKKL